LIFSPYHPHAQSHFQMIAERYRDDRKLFCQLATFARYSRVRSSGKRRNIADHCQRYLRADLSAFFAKPAWKHPM
jgi:hypothetical protein